MMAFQTNSSTNHSTPLPYLPCLVPDVSIETQERLRFITNSVLLPLNLTLAAMSFLGNCLLLIAIARIRTRQHPSLVLLCSLSVSDLMWAVLFLYRDTRKAIHVHLCPPKREEETYLSILCLFLTLSNLAVISKDRHRAVSSPRWYLNHVTKSRAMKESLISWSLSATAMLVVLVVKRALPEKLSFINVIIGLIFVVACSLIITTCYIGIFVASRGHRKAMPQIRARQSVAALTREKKLAITVGLILLALVSTFLPALATPVVLSAMGYKSKTPFRPFFTMFIILNGLLNPLINCGRNESIRRSVHRMFPCQCHKRREPKVTQAGESYSLSERNKGSVKENSGSTSHQRP